MGEKTKMIKQEKLSYEEGKEHEEEERMRRKETENEKKRKIKYGEYKKRGRRGIEYEGDEGIEKSMWRRRGYLISEVFMAVKF
jgi:hypothetical protein